MENIVKPEVLAIIPARGGSKGIPRKNIIDLCGKPLIAYTIEVALSSKLIDRIIVSTDDEEISEISKYYGAEVPFLRSIEISEDKSLIGDAIKFTLDKLKLTGYRPQITVSLYPTHLFRTPELLDFLIGKLIDGYQAVRTVKKVIHNSYSVFSIDEYGRLESLHGTEKKTIKAKTYFREYGVFIGENILGNQKKYVYTLNNPIELIDIDTFQDFYLAEEVIKNKIYNFNIPNSDNNMEIF